MLHLEDVSHVYPNGTRALDHVTLSIPRGIPVSTDAAGTTQ